MGSTRSVSYTHLDVYKRQAENVCKNDPQPEEHASFKKISEIAPFSILKHFISCPPISMTVSYTHLDVYKRQIHGRGAFRFFRATLERFGMETEWYHYRDAYRREIAIEWLSLIHIYY